MSSIFVIGEDTLSCALGERLAIDTMHWEVLQHAINCRGVTNLKKALPRYMRLAHRFPVLCLADTDGKCPVKLLRAWLPKQQPENFILRLAVTESESWILADRDALAEFLKINVSHIPICSDDIPDPKRSMVSLARRSRHRHIRQEMVSSHDPEKPGSGYNQHLCSFVRNHWRPFIAAEQSPSLSKAIRKLSAMSTRSS